MKTLQDVSLLANSLLNKNYTIHTVTGKTFTYNPRKLGYRFQFDNAKRRFGVCKYVSKVIGLSKPLCKVNLDKIDTKIKDTILHEIAHALCVEAYGRIDGRGHDFKWVSIAKQIGCDGKRCYESNKVNLPKSKYTLTCPSCNREFPKHRKISRNHSCSDCSGGYYNEKYKLIVTKNY